MPTRTMKYGTLLVCKKPSVIADLHGDLLSSAWCFWIVHECVYHVQAKDGFQFLYVDGQFSKIQSHILLLNMSTMHACA